MCPSFQATRDEEFSTRGRSNLLRAAMTGKLGPKGMTSKELYQALDLCLSCQACLSECPSAVDMSKLKAEFLHGYYQVHGLPFRSWFFANVAGVSRLAQLFAPLVNLILKSPLAGMLSLKRTSRQGAGVLILYGTQLIPWMLVTRCTFLYHYFPSSMFCLAALALVLARMKHVDWAKKIAAGLCVVALVLFVLYYPALSGLPIPAWWADALNALPSFGFY